MNQQISEGLDANTTDTRTDVFAVADGDDTLWVQTIKEADTFSSCVVTLKYSVAPPGSEEDLASDEAQWVDFSPAKTITGPGVLEVDGPPPYVRGFVTTAEGAKGSFRVAFHSRRGGV